DIYPACNNDFFVRTPVVVEAPNLDAAFGCHLAHQEAWQERASQQGLAEGARLEPARPAKGFFGGLPERECQREHHLDRKHLLPKRRWFGAGRALLALLVPESDQACSLPWSLNGFTLGGVEGLDAYFDLGGAAELLAVVQEAGNKLLTR